MIIQIPLGNVKAYLIRGRKWILVDTGFSFSYKKLVRTLKKYQIEPEDISLIIITHNHIDHVGSLKKIQYLTGAKVLMHRTDAKDLINGESSTVNPVTLMAKVLFKIVRTKHIVFKPHIVFDNEMDLSRFGVEGKVIHTPGHTDGSLSVLLNNGDTLVGDLITGNKKGAKYFYVISNIEDLKSSLKKLIMLGAKRFYTSHKNICDVHAVEKLLEE